MFGISIFGIFIFIIELLRGIRPVKRGIIFKKLKLLVSHPDGYRERLNIKLQKGGVREYRLSSDSPCRLRQEGKKLYISTTEDMRLIRMRKYHIGDGMTVQVRRKKPVFGLTALYMAALLVLPLLAKVFVRTELVDSVSSSAIPVELTHEYSQYIDYDAYDGLLNYLVVGTDERMGMETPHADVILLLSFDRKTKKVRYCSLLRDVYTEMRDKGTLLKEDLDPSLPNYDYLSQRADTSQWIKAKLNYAVNLQYIDDGEHTSEEYFAEGLNSLVNTVENSFRIPIDGVVSVSWTSFIKIIDALGGVKVKITDDMLTSSQTDGHYNGINEVLKHQNALYGYNDRIETSGRQRLNGNMALAYVRMRYIDNADGSDICRTGRIRKLGIKLALQKPIRVIMLTCTDKMTQLTQDVYSSLSEEQIKELFDAVAELPTPTDVGTLPYDFHNMELDGVQYIAVDGKQEPRLEDQAKKLLCGG